jgi:hypothetical protein
MKLWNLSEFRDLEEPVWLAYGKSGGAGPERGIQASRNLSRLKIGLTIAALAANFSVGIAQASGASVSLPLSAVAVAQSIAEPRAPLEHHFQGRFNNEWTENLENDLLMRVETNRLEGSSKSSVEQTIDAVLSNQLEDLQDNENRMSREEIAALVRSRKPSR